MRYLIQVRKDVNDMGVIEAGNYKRSEKDWLNKEGYFDTLDEAINAGRAIIQREVHKARNVRVISVVAEFETKLIVDEVPPS